MEDSLRHGTWELYFPAKDDLPGYWCKLDYDNDKEVGDYYDRCDD